jgi:hypothetical protein
MFFHELARRYQNTLNAAPTAFKGSGKTATETLPVDVASSFDVVRRLKSHCGGLKSHCGGMLRL